MERGGRATTLVATLYIVALVALLAASKPVHAYGEPVARTLLNRTILDIAAPDPTTVYAAAANPDMLYMVKLDPDVRIAGSIQAEIPLPYTPRKLLYIHSGRGDYIAVLMGANSFLIADKTLTISWIRAVPGTVVDAITSGGVIYALTDIPGVGRAVVAVAPGRNGWSEARVIVGTLLEKRLENMEPVQILPVDNLDSILVLYEIKSPSKYSIILSVEAPPVNGTTQPASNATLLIYESETIFLGSGVSDSNGLAEISVPYIPNNTFTVFINYNNTCYSVNINPSDLIKTDDNKYTVKYSVRLGTAKRIPVCPTPRASYYLGLLKLSRDMNLVVNVLNVTIEALNVKLLDAYYTDGKIYVWIGGSLSSIGGIEYRGEGFAYLVFETETYQLLRHRFYAYSGRGYTAKHLSTAYEAVIVPGQLFLASNHAGDYYLTWSIPLPEALSSISIYELNAGTFVLGLASRDSLYLVKVYDGKAYFISDTPSRGIDAGTRINDVDINNKSIYLASDKGLIVVDNIRYERINVTGIASISIGSVSVNIVDELNGTSVCGVLDYVLEARLQGRRVAILKGFVSGCGTFTLPHGPGLVTVAEFAPNSTLYTGLRFTITDTSSNITLKVKRRVFTFNLVMVDAYTSSPPLRPLNITINAQDYNGSVKYHVSAGTESLSVRLPAGMYVVQVVDGGLYMDSTESIVLDSDKSVRVELRRIPVRVSIGVSVTLEAEPRDVVTVTVTGENGTVLYSVDFTSPRVGDRILVEFDTEYRGPARVEVVPKPGGGAASAFYEPTTITINITDEGAAADVILKPRLYTLSVSVADAETGEPVNATIKLLSKGKVVGEATGARAVFKVVRGAYTLVAEPLPLREFNISIYAAKSVTIKVESDRAVRLLLERIRGPATVIVKDPYAPGNVTADDLEIYVDDILFGKLKANTLVKPVTVLAATTGSKLVIRSVHGVYEDYSSTIKPGGEPVLVIIQRKLYSVTINVLNDVGSGVSGARVDITGTNVVYSTSVVTGNDGRAVVPLPYGEYQVCVSANGYYPQCSKVAAVGNVETTIVLKPQPLTLVMRYMPLIIAVIVSVVLVVVVRSYFKRLLERISGEEEF